MLLQHQLVFDLLVDTTLLDGTGLARVFRTSRTGLTWAARAAARRIKAPKDADDGTTPCRAALVDSAAFLDIADVITACGPVTAACGAHVVAADARGAVAWGRGRHGQRGGGDESGEWRRCRSSGLMRIARGSLCSCRYCALPLAVLLNFNSAVAAFADAH